MFRQALERRRERLERWWEDSLSRDKVECSAVTTSVARERSRHDIVTYSPDRERKRYGMLSTEMRGRE
jgi:hypothetical protein